MVSVKVKTISVENEITQIKQDLNNFTTLFALIRREFLIKRIKEIFASDGYGTWAPTTRPNPILRDTLALYRSYTQPGVPGNINIETPTSLTWGSDIFYAEFHEYGTSNMIERPVLELLDVSEIERLVEEWVESIV